MTQDDEFTKDQVIEALTWKRQQLADHEKQWKTLREDSKFLTLRLVTEHGVSVAGASKISGHHRNTIMLWLQIHNAEMKSSKTRDVEGEKQ
jgi:hypothetical protein